MAKLTLPPFVGQPGAGQLNTWKTQIEEAIEDTLSRSGQLPNDMEAQLDMHENDIINIKMLDVDELFVDGLDIKPAVEEAVANSSQALSNSNQAVSTSNNAFGIANAALGTAVSEVVVQPFPDRPSFIAADIPPAVTRAGFLVGGNAYFVVRDATGPIEQANGDKWKPDNIAVIYVDAVVDLQALDTSVLVDGQQVSVREYTPGLGLGAAIYAWDATADRSKHDGRLYVSPGVPGVDSQSLSDYEAGVGETNPGNNGLWVMISGSLARNTTLRVPSMLRGTLQESIDWVTSLSRANTAARLNILFESGYEISERMLFRKGHFGHVFIQAEGGEVSLSSSFPSGQDVIDIRQAHGPTLECLIKCNGGGRKGYHLQNGIGRCDPGGGIDGAGEDNFTISESIFRGRLISLNAGRFGVHFANGSTGGCRQSEIKGSTAENIFFSHQSSADFDECVIEDSLVSNIRIRGGSQCAFRICEIRGSGDDNLVVQQNAKVTAFNSTFENPGDLNVRHESGATVDLTGSNVDIETTTAEAFNDVTGRGVIYNQDQASSGTWNPVISGSSVAGSHTYQVQDGEWVRQGRMVFITFRVRLSNFDSNAAGDLRISLPAELSNKRSGDIALSIARVANTQNPPANYQGGFAIEVAEGNASLRYYRDNASTAAALIEDFATNTLEIRASGWYPVL